MNWNVACRLTHIWFRRNIAEYCCMRSFIVLVNEWYTLVSTVDVPTDYAIASQCQHQTTWGCRSITGFRCVCAYCLLSSFCSSETDQAYCWVQVYVCVCLCVCVCMHVLALLMMLTCSSVIESEHTHTVTVTHTQYGSCQCFFLQK